MNIPNTWRAVRLADICEIGAGNGAPQDALYFDGGEHLFVRTQDVSNSRDSVYITATKDKVNEKAIHEHKLKLWPKGTLLFPKSGASALLNNRALLSVDSYVVSHLATIVPGDRVLPEYLYYWSTQFDAKRLAPDPAYPSIRLEDIARIKLPLPTLPEQQRIVEILKQADNLRRWRREIINQAKQLPATLLLEIFGNPKEWGGYRVKLGNISTFVTSGSRDWSKYYSSSNSDAKFIRVQNIKAGELDLSDMAFVKPPENTEAERARVQPGDLLISITGTVGQVAVVPPSLGKAYISQHVAIVRTDGTLPVEFLVEFLNHPAGGQLQIQRANYGQTKPGLNLQQIKNLSIPIFDTEKIARSISAKNETVSVMRAFEATTTELDQLQQSLLQAAFAGDLTEEWRQAHRAELDTRRHEHAEQLPQKTVRISFKDSASPERVPASSSRRLELLNQLSLLQGFVHDALREWKGTLIPAEHLQEFMGQWPVEHLEDLHDQVLRALDQLAGLGLIARVSIPNQQGEYVTGYRMLREDELTKFDDLQRLGAPA